MHNVVNLAERRFLKYVWPFYNIMHERVNRQIVPINQPDESLSNLRGYFSCFL